MGVKRSRGVSCKEILRIFRSWERWRATSYWLAPKERNREEKGGGSDTRRPRGNRHASKKKIIMNTPKPRGAEKHTKSGGEEIEKTENTMGAVIRPKKKIVWTPQKMAIQPQTVKEKQQVGLPIKGKG